MVLEEAVRVTEEVTPRFALNIPGTGGFYCHKVRSWSTLTGISSNLDQ